MDIDCIANKDFRVIQFTPPGSGASIIFGKGVTAARPGSIDRLVLAVSDIDATPRRAPFARPRSRLGVPRRRRRPRRRHSGRYRAARSECRSPTPFIRLVCLVCLVPRSRRQRLAAGDQGAAPGPGCDDGRYGSRTAPALNGRPSLLNLGHRSIVVRGGRPTTRLVGLVRGVHGRSRARDLTIVQRAIHFHNLKLLVANAHPGLLVSVELPLS